MIPFIWQSEKSKSIGLRSNFDINLKILLRHKFQHFKINVGESQWSMPSLQNKLKHTELLITYSINDIPRTKANKEGFVCIWKCSYFIRKINVPTPKWSPSNILIMRH